jgi:hypothetical protein
VEDAGHCKKRENQYGTTTTFMSHVCASHSRLQPTTQDHEMWRKSPEFALSRWQRGFETLGMQDQTAFDEVKRHLSVPL